MVVRKGGLEPPTPKGLDPKSSAYTNSATFAGVQAGIDPADGQGPTATLVDSVNTGDRSSSVAARLLARGQSFAVLKKAINPTRSTAWVMKTFSKNTTARSHSGL